jgi:hypothetical protein
VYVARYPIESREFPVFLDNFGLNTREKMRKDAVRFGRWAGLAISPPFPSICPIAVVGSAASGAVALFDRFDNPVVGEKEEVAGKQRKARFIMQHVLNREQSDEGNYASLLESGEMFVKRKACPKCGAWLSITPCRSCRIRESMKRYGRLPLPPDEPDEQ